MSPPPACARPRAASCMWSAVVFCTARSVAQKKVRDDAPCEARRSAKGTICATLAPREGVMSQKTHLRIGVDLGGTKIEAIALERDGREALRKRVLTPRGDYAATVAAIAALVQEIGDGAVGIGIPGALSRLTGLVKNANSTWLIGRPLKEDLERALGRAVRVENDANCFALSEAVDGAGKGARAVFGVILGTGVGGGIVIDGQLLVGCNALAGGWGHNPLPLPRA